MSVPQFFKIKTRWRPNLKYHAKALAWLIGNSIFGLGPLLFMCVVKIIAEKKIASENIEHQIRGGTILFVCCAMMGSILIDFFISSIPLKGLTALFIYGIPIGTLIFLLINYLLIYLRIIDSDYFSFYSNTSKSVIALSILYSSITKSILYKKEDRNHDRNNL